MTPNFNHNLMQKSMYIHTNYNIYKIILEVQFPYKVLFEEVEIKFF